MAPAFARRIAFACLAAAVILKKKRRRFLSKKWLHLLKELVPVLSPNGCRYL